MQRSFQSLNKTMERNLLIPSFLFDEPFRYMSASAKILYGLLLIESAEHQKMDENGRGYVEYSRSKIKKALNVANDKARDILNELENADLIKREALIGKNARIYIN